MSLDVYAADLLADAIQGGTPFEVPATLYVHLCTTAPTKTTPGTDSGLGGAAATMATDWASDDAGLLTSGAIFDFGNAAGDASGVHWVELWDTVDSAGQRWLYGTLSSTYNIFTGQPVSFPVGALRIPVS